MTIDDLASAISNADSFEEMKVILFPESKPVCTDSMTQVMEYLKLKTGKNFRSMKKIESRLREGFTEEDLKLIVDWKVLSWAGTEMDQYLRPETLFRSKNKSGSYLDEALNWQAKIAGEKKVADEKEQRRGRVVVPKFGDS